MKPAVTALCVLLLSVPAAAEHGSPGQEPGGAGDRTVVSYRLDGRLQPASSGNWVPASADILVAVEPGTGEPGRAYTRSRRIDRSRSCL